MKAIARLDEDFARFEKMRATEGEAIVEQHAAIGDVDGLQIDRQALAELLAEREVKRSVRLKVIAGSHRRLIAVAEAGGVGDRWRQKHAMGKRTGRPRGACCAGRGPTTRNRRQKKSP